MKHMPTKTVGAVQPELATRLQDPQSGPVERLRVLNRLHALQTQLRRQADRGFSATAYARLEAARQAVDAALQILDKVPTCGGDVSTGPAHTPVFSKGETT
jgi:hypothetical protein